MKNKQSTPEIELEEIKTILQQLQSMQVPKPQAAPANKSDNRTYESRDTARRRASNPQAEVAERSNNMNLVIILTITLSVFGTTALLLFINGFAILEKEPVKQASSVQQEKKTVTKREVKPKVELSVPFKSNENQVVLKKNRNVVAAEDLLKKGSILKARQLLLSEAEKTSGGNSRTYVNISYLIAQSYDPNYLASLNFADSDADLVEAERWYRIWHKAAYKQGIVTSNNSLQSILQTLR